MLKEICKTCVLGEREFVGLRFEGDKPAVHFPRGYRLNFSNDETLRKDITLLLGVLYKFATSQEGSKGISDGEMLSSFPLISYQYIIQDFLMHGYYIEKEDEYKIAKKGKIKWKQTIQKVKPIANEDNFVYLDFIVKNNKHKENNLITKIHEFCVYESFLKLGWLYLNNQFLPQKPTIKFNKRIFKGVLERALCDTFNDAKKRLFKSMLNIVCNVDESISENTNITFGTNHFEFVWEKIVDYIFGEDNKDIYFPRATWHIVDGIKSESSALEPDTIMIKEKKVYILDAKYYKYGLTGNINDLPATASVQKQITYGDYVENKFGKSKVDIYNAFIMPFNKLMKNDDNYKFVSIGTADWVNYNKCASNHKYVVGILADTKNLIETYSRKNCQEIEQLSRLIVNSVENIKILF